MLEAASAKLGSVLRFRMFNIPITVRPSFFLIAALLGLLGRSDPLFVTSWVLIVFVSVLVHELGHAFTARGFGAETAIELNGIGGLTRWSVPVSSFGPGKRGLVAASGSVVGVLFGGFVWVAAAQFGPYEEPVALVINNLILVNVFWGLLNWLPIRPLDGGHLLEALLEKTAPEHGPTIAKVVFSVTAAVALALALRARLIFIALISGWLLLAEFSTPRTNTAPIPPLTYDLPEEDVEVTEIPHDDHEPGDSDH